MSARPFNPSLRGGEGDAAIQFDGLRRHDGLNQCDGWAENSPCSESHPQHWIAARHAALAAEG